MTYQYGLLTVARASFHENRRPDGRWSSLHVKLNQPFRRVYRATFTTGGTSRDLSVKLTANTQQTAEGTTIANPEMYLVDLICAEGWERLSGALVSPDKGGHAEHLFRRPVAPNA